MSSCYYSDFHGDQTGQHEHEQGNKKILNQEKKENIISLEVLTFNFENRFHFIYIYINIYLYKVTPITQLEYESISYQNQ